MTVKDCSKKGFLKILATVLCVIEAVCSFGIVILDARFLTKINKSITFTYKEIFNNGGVSEYSMLRAIVILGVFFTILSVAKLFYQLLFHCLGGQSKNIMGIVMLQTAIVLVLELPRETMYFYVTNYCLHHYHQTLIRARTILTLILMAVYVAFAVIYLLYKTQPAEGKPETITKLLKIIRIVAIIFCFFLCGIVIVMNVIINQNLEPGNNPSLKTSEINVGLFNFNEINSIKDGSFIKDEYYNYRILTTLDKVMYSDTKQRAYRLCKNSEQNTETRRRCKTFYYRRYDVVIPCDSHNSLFYTDCTNYTNGDSIIFRIEYFDDESEYPRYSCAFNSSKNHCVQGCNITSEYMIIMTQEKSNVTQLAWKDFGECTAQPKVNFYYDYGIDVCFGMSIFKSNWFTYFISFMFLYLFSINF